MSSNDGSDAFGDFGNSEDNDTLELPSFAHLFPTFNDLIEYSQSWAIGAGYSLVIRRSTCDDSGEKNRVYLRCDRGTLPKAGQETTRLIDCKFQLAGHRRDEGWLLSVDRSKGILI
jgi:hypothetical protein